MQPDTKIKELKIAAMIGAAFVRPTIASAAWAGAATAGTWSSRITLQPLGKCIYKTRKLARVYVFDYIEVFYN